MPKKRWTTPEQCAWLEARIPAFVQAQQAKTTSAFLDDTHHKWQERWPIAEPIGDEVQSAEGDVERARAAKQKALEDVSNLEKCNVQTYAYFSFSAREILVS
jgi:hypothetical protein